MKNSGKNHTYTGLGFPIQLRDVEMLKIEGEWHPKINVKRIADKAIKTLVTQKSRLTGNQIKFIRTYFAMSLRTFAKEVVNESHMAVKKWEDCADKATKMDPNIEIVLRLTLWDRINTSKKRKTEFYDRFQQITHMFQHGIPDELSAVQL